MITVPAAFAAEVAHREGAAGHRWLAGLPGLVDDLLADWDLVADGAVAHGHAALVVPVRRRRGGEAVAAVLKVSWPDAWTRDEGTALRAWCGRGAVAVLEHDPARTALLLERLDPGASLLGEPEREAVERAAAVLVALDAAPPEGLRATASTADRWSGELPRQWRALGRPGDARAVAAAAGTAAELARGPGPARLVHGDLHYGNVLRAPDRPGRPWVAIDPQPQAGDREFDVLPLLRNRWSDGEATGDPAAACRARLAAVVDGAGLDAERARAWCLVRTVDDALWGAEHDDARFSAIAWAIAAALRDP